MTIKQGEENVGAKYRKTLQGTGKEYLQFPRAQATITSEACRKIEYERGLYQPNRMLALAQGHNLYFGNKNRGSLASAALCAFG